MDLDGVLLNVVVLDCLIGSVFFIMVEVESLGVICLVNLYLMVLGEFFGEMSGWFMCVRVVVEVVGIEVCVIDCICDKLWIKIIVNISINLLLVIM